jgi:hypothetical protein
MGPPIEVDIKPKPRKTASRSSRPGGHVGVQPIADDDDDGAFDLGAALDEVELSEASGSDGDPDDASELAANVEEIPLDEDGLELPHDDAEGADGHDDGTEAGLSAPILGALQPLQLEAVRELVVTARGQLERDQISADESNLRVLCTKMISLVKMGDVVTFTRWSNVLERDASEVRLDKNNAVIMLKAGATIIGYKAAAILVKDTGAQMLIGAAPMPDWVLRVRARANAQDFGGPLSGAASQPCIVCTVLGADARCGSGGSMSMFVCKCCLTYWHMSCAVMLDDRAAAYGVVFICPVCSSLDAVVTLGTASD